MIRAIIIGFLLLVLFPCGLLAGWVITEKNADAYDVQTQTIYMQSNKMKLPGKQETLILELDSGMLTFILENHQAYWYGSIEDFSTGMVEALEMQLSVILPQLPKEEQEDYERSYRQRISKYESNEDKYFPAGNVQLTKSGDQKKILAYTAERYDVTVNDIKVEELWFTDDIHPFEEIDYDAFTHMLDRMSLKAELGYSRSDKYMELLLSGYPLHAIKYNEDEEMHVVATMIEEREIPASTFDPPRDYKKMTMSELMSLVIGN